MVMDSIIKKLNDEGIFAQVYSDDLTISIRGKFEGTLGDQMRYSVKVVESWCWENGLKVKTNLVLFSGRHTGSEPRLNTWELCLTASSIGSSMSKTEHRKL